MRIYVRDRKQNYPSAQLGEQTDCGKRPRTTSNDALTSRMGQRLRARECSPSQRIETSPEENITRSRFRKPNQTKQNSSYVNYRKIRYWFLPIGLIMLRRLTISGLSKGVGDIMLL